MRDKYGRFNVNVDGTYYANFAGSHTFKAGVQWERLSNDVLQGAQAPTVTLNWNAQRITLDDPPRQVRGPYGYYTVARSYTEGKIHSNNIGFFIQDSWTLNNRLTLNLGLRTDGETIPSYRPENPSLEFGLTEKLAPRAGFAYDIQGNGQWKAYGSWGMFYDISKLEMPRGAWGADRWIDYHYTLDSFNWPAINCEGPQGSGCPGTFIEQADRRHVSNDPNDNLIDPDLKPIRTQEFTLGMDHELTSTMSIGVRYAHKWLDKTIEDVGIQVAGVGEVFMIANPGYGIAEYTLAATCPTCPAQPPAKRDYDAVEFRLRKRLSNRWSMNTSYVYSALQGNYSGLTSSDENGRNSPSVLRFFDGLYMSFDSFGNPIDGRLQTDRPHYFKFQGTYDMPWGTMVGFEYRAASGTLQQSVITYKSVPVFSDARGDLGRSPIYTQTDLLFQHDVPLPGRTEDERRSERHQPVRPGYSDATEHDALPRSDRRCQRRPVLPGLRPCRARRQPWPEARCAVRPVRPVPRSPHDSRAGDAALLVESKGLELGGADRLRPFFVQPIAARRPRVKLDSPRRLRSLRLHMPAAYTVQKRPANARARANYATILLAEGRIAEAEQHLRQAVAADPRRAEAQIGLGVALAAQRRFDEGLPHLRTAFELAPDNAEVNRNLGEAYAAQGSLAEAVRHYDAALRVRPDDVMLLNRVGWILATTTTEGLRDGARARTLAERAVQLTRGLDPESLDKLAAALAEIGRFDEAAETVRRALDRARAGRSELVPELEARLALYQRREAFRQ